MSPHAIISSSPASPAEAKSEQTQAQSMMHSSSSTRPPVICGKSFASLTFDELQNRLRDGMARASGRKEYKKVAVLMFTWHRNHDDVDSASHISLDVLAEVYRTKYGFEVETLELDCQKYRDDIPIEKREYHAYNQLSQSVIKLRKSYDDDDSLIIVHYAGHAIRSPEITHTYGYPRDESLMWLVSGCYEDLFLRNHHLKMPGMYVRTKLPFESTMVKLLGKNTKADVLFCMDSPCHPGVATAPNHSLLGACALGDTVTRGPKSLTEQMANILSQAHAEKQWKTLGEVHSLILRNVLDGKSMSCPVWHHGMSKSGDNSSILLKPVGTADDNLVASRKMLSRETVFISVHLDSLMSESDHDRLDALLSYADVDNERTSPVKRPMGRVILHRSCRLRWLLLEIDAVLYHELAPHDAILFAGGP